MKFQDYRSRPEESIAVIRRLLGRGPRELSVFPYPNGAKLRTFSVLDPLDEVVLRWAAGRTAPAVERALNRLEPEVHVMSYRLAQLPPAWRYRDPMRADAQRRRLAAAGINHVGFRGFGKSDVSGYYMGIDAETLSETLLRIGADARAVMLIEVWLKHWQGKGVLQGLPIGPQAAGILGNAYLLPVDRALAPVAREMIRLTDAWHSESTLGLALTEGRPVVQRAATLSFRSHLSKNHDRLAVKEVQSAVPDLEPTTNWVLAKAA